MLLLLLACGSEQPPAAAVEVSPPAVDGGPAESVIVEKNKLLRPDGREIVIAGEHASLPWESFLQLEVDQQQVALSILNKAAGSCPACLEQGISLADCALEPPPGCENTPALAQRCIRLAAEGRPTDEIYDLCAFHEPWIELDLSGLEGRGGGPVVVVVAVDPTNPASLAYEPTVQQLREAFPTQMTLYLLDVVQHPDKAQAWGVRSTPTVFVDGYRLRGSRSLDNLSHMVRASLLDHDA